MRDPISFDMKHAIITGGAGLIGTGICRALLDAGWRVASFDMKDTDEDLQAAGVRHIFCDVGDEASVAGAFAELGWENLDLLVNNAGVAGPVNGPIQDLSLEDWRRVTDSHLTAAFLMTRSAVPLMGEGTNIINMGSTRAFMSEPQTEAYAASKGGLVALTHALAVSLGPKIRVNAIAPGWISGDAERRTEDHAQHPVGRVGHPQDVAEAVLYLTGAGFMTGQVLMLDGGMTRKMIYAE
ncbi:SDR family NAD(P)-dependent oxidoreductase [Allorhizobium pseudoryzae]|uniref:SDR family NAD(P)-dependent oxidoreductase n=1 Tax=Allorhizobium pseudoryzae TaxID=379684 RepID=UPI003D032FB0